MQHVYKTYHTHKKALVKGSACHGAQKPPVLIDICSAATQSYPNNLKKQWSVQNMVTATKTTTTRARRRTRNKANKNIPISNHLEKTSRRVCLDPLSICICIGPQTKTERHGRGSYLFSIIIHLEAGIAGCQPTCLDLPKRCLDLPSSAANSLDSRIAGCQPTCLDLPGLA